MARSLTLVDSTIQVLTTAEAKQHLRVANDGDDTYIDNLIFAATKMAESYCNIQIMQTSCTQIADCWADTFELYQSPVQNSGQILITSIKYYDEDNVQQTWAATNYILDSSYTPARISVAPQITYPPIANRLDAIEIRFRSGYLLSSEVPKLLKQAILILVGQWYENRQEAIVGRSVGTIPMTATYIMDRYKIQTLGLSLC
tara:strand:+ start:616 stop:1218 length:603 start_codon:yes stop_codon:yes gene_type:complete